MIQFDAGNTRLMCIHKASLKNARVVGVAPERVHCSYYNNRKFAVSAEELALPAGWFRDWLDRVGYAHDPARYFTYRTGRAIQHLLFMTLRKSLRFVLVGKYRSACGTWQQDNEGYYRCVLDPLQNVNWTEEGF